MSMRTTPWPAGFPCWTDLSTPDVPAAQRFYGALFGWSFSEPDARFGGYVIASSQGTCARPTTMLPAASTPTSSATTTNRCPVRVRPAVRADPAGALFCLAETDGSNDPQRDD